MTREMTPADFERQRAIAEEGYRQMLIWVAENRRPGETWGEARTRYREIWNVKARAEIRKSVALVEAARTSPMVKEDRVIIHPIVSPFGAGWLPCVATPIRSVSLRRPRTRLIAAPLTLFEMLNDRAFTLCIRRP